MLHLAMLFYCHVDCFGFVWLAKVTSSKNICDVVAVYLKNIVKICLKYFNLIVTYSKCSNLQSEVRFSGWILEQCLVSSCWWHVNLPAIYYLYHLSYIPPPPLSLPLSRLLFSEGGTFATILAWVTTCPWMWTMMIWWWNRMERASRI